MKNIVEIKQRDSIQMSQTDSRSWKITDEGQSYNLLKQRGIRLEDWFYDNQHIIPQTIYFNNNELFMYSTFLELGENIAILEDFIKEKFGDLLMV
ncbi:hypothetical protein [Holzapfeliella floricola]|uniref:Uncharacterized protein n=1 Tax=Holzapfeliella floricola DSM 23037 = JCM 16512 TaxID=1423744 RepID=A0A0R2DJZ7_9LACO|nr:hypothetical protein [Holzapfeliella floricola]KRN04006.1 hypothetical protein FC86_GL000536 [Holzapfeliella floricola DSM 23037 = JCM 16512]